MSDILVKNANKNVIKELNSIGFDKSYINSASYKYHGNLYKVFNLKPYEANILKQICLSLGFDCAVNRNSVTCKCEITDCLLFANSSQLSKLILNLEKQPFRLKELASELKNIINHSLEPLTIKDYIFDWSKPYIMGILNITPDSFSDGGKYNNINSALIQCRKLISEGADIIDIGGESTRPSAQTVSTEEEIKRVIPIIKAIREDGISVPISIDTRNYKTAEEALNSGADIVNDVSGLDYDKNLFDFVSKNNIPVIIMHSDKVPAVSSDFTNRDAVEEIYFSLNSKISKLLNAGMYRKNIIADVGIGFGKSAETSFELLKRMEEFKTLNVALLLGISRKSFIRSTFNVDFEQSDIVTALYSSNMTCINIHRVHNAGLTKKFLEFTHKLN